MRGFQEWTWNRRAFLRGVVQVAALVTAENVYTTDALSANSTHGEPDVEPMLASFVERYMREMYAPGMTLGMVHADGHTTVSGFGLSDVARKQPVKPEMLFQIGSISKSFCALALLQMSDEGMLDVQKPVLEYLPWLPIETPYGDVTVHHLLTHSTGLPDNPPLFLSDRSVRHKQGFKPGTQFHYCNLGFEILGHLAATLDGKSYASVLRERLLDPLAMTATRPVISNEIRANEVQSYVFYRDDLESTPDARLEVAPRAVFDSGAGCIASTADDMTRYMRMLLGRGKGPKDRIVSEESFELFARPHIKAEYLGKGAYYGYGIVVDTLDGHKLLRHTGGMQSFVSSMEVDLDGRVAAFASINANQGYRPNPVAKYSLQVMRAQAENKPVPEPEVIDDPRTIENAEDYAGAYAGDAGSAQVVAERKTLAVVMGATHVRLQRATGDKFVAEDAAWQAFQWVFLREKSANSGEKAPVTEMMFGSKWYVNAAYKGPKAVAAPKRFARFEGVYDSRTNCLRVVICKGMLVAGGTPLVEIGDGLFRASDELNSPETVEFLHEVNGRARMALLSGVPYWRVETA
jgi:CubicO group peptidase (beta-lactamase class C family)